MTGVGDEPLPEVDKARRRQGVASVLKWLLFLTIIYFVGRALWRQLAALDWHAIHFHLLPVLVAAAALALIYAGRAASFRALLAGYGVRLTWREAAIVGWIPQIGKFIPGQVASLAGAIALLRRFNTPAPVALAVVTVMDGLAVLTGLIAGSPLLTWEPVRSFVPLGGLWFALLIIGGGICLHPRIYGRLLNLGLRLIRRPELDRLPTWRSYVGPLLIGFAQWILAGFALWLITRSVTFVDAGHLPLFIAIAGLGYTAGYLAPFAPGGLGVREAVFQATLSLVVGAPAAVVVILMRLVQTLVEIASAVAGWALLRNSR